VILRPDFSTLSHETEWMLMGLAVASALIVIYFTHQVFIRNGVLPVQREEQMKPWQRVIYNKYYVDEIYDYLVRRPIDFLSGAFHKILDKQLIDGIVNGVGSGVKSLGSAIRMIQNGNIGFYVTGMAVGVIVIILLTFLVK
jgi:NADH-quinone oxidoreductase subunit L